MVLDLIIGATIAVSLISFIGVLTLFLRETVLQRILIGLVSLAAGTLLGAVFFDLLPEAASLAGAARLDSVLLYALLGIVSFFIIEKFLYWHHHHFRPQAQKERIVRTFTYLNLIGDGVHNFLDGVLIALSFVVNPNLGFITTLAVALHEIPQEIGDFGLLVYGGVSKGRAILFNFASAVTAIAGALIAFYFSSITGMTEFFLPFLAGAFLYIALTDLLPEITQEISARRSLLQLGAMLAGIILMWQLSIILKV